MITNVNHPLLPFINLLKHSPINMINNLLVIVVVAEVTIFKDSHENLAINFVLTLVQILAQDIIITTFLKTFQHIMIVIDPVMINITKTPLHDHFTILAPITIQHHLVVHINLNFVLVNASLAIITPPLYAINHHTVLLLNYVLIAIEIDLALTQEITQILNIFLLSIFLNNQLPIFIVLPQQNLNLKYLYLPSTSSCSQSSNIQANAITPSTWFVNLYIFKPPEYTLYHQK